ncbi:MAG: hypothetical protein KatS3mg120_0896 [Erythrobacter sp.]|nr:MAG: hypothetical protein KatS3mg120_0896 [Erythrobacter sp.]
MSEATIAPTSEGEKQQGGTAKWWLIGTGAFLAAFYAFCGFYTVQPIGALPDGATAIVWRESGEPFFNSADALCLERMGGVSLMCRGMAMAQAPTDRIILRLPYLHFAYTMSTGGKEFDR